MTFGEHVFLYCERGTNPALLAEPINALSNVAFLLAGLVGLQLVLWRPPEDRNADLFLLPVLVLFIGLGSLSFHLYADQGTSLADVVPITVFMLVYLGFALTKSTAAPWVLMGIYGLYNAMTEGVTKAFVTDVVPAHQRAGAIGLFYTVSGLSMFCASFVAGAVWDQRWFGGTMFAPFALGAICAALAVPIVLTVPRAKQTAT